MISAEQAIELAKAFTSSFGEVATGVYFTPSKFKEFPGFYYFDFLLVDQEGTPADVMMGGAPGFSINKINGAASVMDWATYHGLQIFNGYHPSTLSLTYFMNSIMQAVVIRNLHRRIKVIGWLLWNSFSIQLSIAVRNLVHE